MDEQDNVVPLHLHFFLSHWENALPQQTFTLSSAVAAVETSYLRLISVIYCVCLHITPVL